MENYNISLDELLSINYQEELVYFISDKIDKAPRGTDIYPEYVFGTNSLDLQQNAAWLRAITIRMRDYNAPFYPSKSPQEYMQTIVEDGDDEALLDLGILYKQGYGVEQSDEIAYKLFLRSAKQGNPIARTFVGHCCKSGVYVEVNVNETVKWYELSAQGHYLEGYRFLVQLCFELRDFEKVLYWTNRYVEYGFAEAMLNLGRFYISGEIIERDMAKGFDLIHRAAEIGFPPAQYDCGLCYIDGYGVDIDTNLGMSYISKAADANYKPAIEFLNNRR